jgi:hypothetical protein
MTATQTQTDLMYTAVDILMNHADNATPGPWQHMCMGSDGCQIIRDAPMSERKRRHIAWFGRKEWQHDHADAGYVAMMAPPVAHALAAWLQVKAASPGDHDYGYALAVAQQIVNPAEAQR